MRPHVQLFRAAVGLLIALSAGLGPTTAAQSASEPARTVWDGVYSAEQATRGQSQYGTHCANCHADDLSGYQSLLKGERFMNDYREASLYRLFDKMKTTMPRSAAGSLADGTYLDIMSYVLKANEFPAGASELKPEDLSSILVTGIMGPAPVPDFSLVEVVGCLARRDSDNAWMLTRATEPARATRPQPSPTELAALTAKPLGAGTFRLLASAAYNPDPAKDRKVEVRGFLIRRRDDNRINITSLEPVGDDCSR